MSKRAILYARHSTDHQNPKSSVDQLAACRAYTERKGYLVLAEFADEAKTSASLHNRPGLDAVRAIAKGGQVQGCSLSRNWIDYRVPRPICTCCTASWNPLDRDVQRRRGRRPCRSASAA